MPLWSEILFSFKPIKGFYYVAHKNINNIIGRGWMIYNFSIIHVHFFFVVNLTSLYFFHIL